MNSGWAIELCAKCGHVLAAHYFCFGCGYRCKCEACEGLCEHYGEGGVYAWTRGCS